jgi:hypothetical protein
VGVAADETTMICVKVSHGAPGGIKVE